MGNTLCADEDGCCAWIKGYNQTNVALRKIYRERHK